MAAITGALDFSTINFDYLITGGGTAGLVLAARLSENASVTVGVLEAGLDYTGDIKVQVAGLFKTLVGDTKYDWNFTSTAQPNLNGRSIAQNRGKQLGGSSAINALQYTKATAADLDDWEALGNYGWNYDILMDYYRKSESYQAPAEEVAKALDLDYIDPAVHGTMGPINVTIPSYYTPAQEAFSPTYKSLGLGVDGDPYGGYAGGGFTNLMFIGSSSARAYSANKYLLPVTQRPNLKVTTGVHVHNVTFAPKSGNQTDLIANGLFFSTADGQVFRVSAKKEVILSAGVFGSPQILELSGVGSRQVLEAEGIPVVIENPNVGENLQDHTLVPLNFPTASGERTLNFFLDNNTIAQLLVDYAEKRTGPLTGGTISTALLSYTQVLPSSQKSRIEELISTYLNGSYEANKPGLAEQYEVLKTKLSNPNDTSAQIVLSGGGSYVSPKNANTSFILMCAINAHPFSRGSSHISSSNATAPPTINPGYLTHPIDMQILIDIVQHVRRVAQTAPLAQHFAFNGSIVQDDIGEFNASSAEAFIRDEMRSDWHPAGTCAMQPRELGGVVSPRLIVYGTKNLRVVDLSIAPVLPRGNPTSLVYALAEKAADMIKIGANTTIPGFNN